MNIQLRYFTGTGNSLKIIDTCRQRFIAANHHVQMNEIGRDADLNLPSDLAGFCFPVYSFGVPRIARQYLEQVPKFKIRQKAFVLITAGDPDEGGLSVDECVKILKKKNCQIVYSAVVHMPANWTTFIQPLASDEFMPIVDKGVEQANLMADEIMRGIGRFHPFNYPKRYSRLGFYVNYYLFKYLGIYNMWRTFRVYPSCNGCQLCSKLCPTHSIQMKNGKPNWLATCEQCMRCVNFCPQQSIYQTYGGNTIGKNRYIEPSFKPLKRSN